MGLYGTVPPSKDPEIPIDHMSKQRDEDEISWAVIDSGSLFADGAEYELPKPTSIFF